MDFEFNKAVFTYAVSEKKIDIFKMQLKLETRELFVNYTESTSICHLAMNGCEVVIIGLCVDSYGLIEKGNIASEILQLSVPSIEAIYDFANRLGGKYAIIYSKPNECYIFGDATCSIPLYYSGNLKDGKICISPFDKMTAEYFSYSPDMRLLKMRESADPSQTMPGDLTPYKEVKALLPNQYLDMVKGEAVRVEVHLPELSFAEVIDDSVRISKNTAREFAKDYSLICPLTCGYDSRVVLSILQQITPEMECFTTSFSPNEEKSLDIKIAKEICQKENIGHKTFGYYDPPNEYIEMINKSAGLINSEQTIKEAYSYVIEAGNKARINGNIIGQIGKSSVMNCVPDSMATASFLTCKIHNRDRNCYAAMKKYIDELKKSNNCVCDLFAYENRCGRWGGQEEALYSLCGMNSLNLFNCRRLILSWISIPRKHRVNTAIHLEMIEKTNPDLLIEPFNPDDRFSFLKKNWIPYFIATFVKQIIIQYKKM